MATVSLLVGPQLRVSQRRQHLQQQRPVRMRGSLNVTATATTPGAKDSKAASAGSTAQAAPNVPIINIADFYTSPEKKKAIGKALVKAAEEVGFFYIAGHSCA